MSKKNKDITTQADGTAIYTPGHGDGSKAPMASNAESAPATGKPVETKADKFRRLANRRVNKAIKVLSHVENLSRVSQYEYTFEQADKLRKVIKSACDRIDKAFSGDDKVAVAENLF